MSTLCKYLIVCSILSFCGTSHQNEGGIILKNGIDGISLNNEREEIDVITCGASMSKNGSYFVNPDYPENTINFSEICQITINKVTNNICQIRLDFTEFDIAPPDPESGQCIDDVFTVNGGTTSIPTICGENSEQHMYIDVDPNNGSPIQINLDAYMMVDYPRIFNIKVTQIACNSTSLSPPGCLQYYTTTTGLVESFNFPNLPATSVSNAETVQLANQQYAICVRPEAGYCGISWSPNNSPDKDPYSFFLTGDSTILGQDTFGTLNVAGFDNACSLDYITIPGGTYTAADGTVSLATRFCGAGLPSSVTTSFKPFVLYYKTDNDEDLVSQINIRDEKGNTGFSLTFRQSLCI